MDIKVSIITTIYGVEKYIERCATSLFEQTMTSDIEFIFVDDCSKDNSIEKLKSLIKKYPLRSNQIKLLIHEENKGLPQARLTGLKQASGKYIWFVDSDDWIESNACELFYTTASMHDLDIVISDYNICKGYEVVTKHVYIRREKLLSDILLENTNCSVWNKFIRRSLFASLKIEFPIANMGEDLAIISQLFVHDLQVGKIDRPLYNYFINPNSISLIRDNDSYIRRHRELKTNTQILIQTLQNHGLIGEYENELKYRKYAVIAQLTPIISNSSIYSTWRNAYPELTPKSILFSKINLSAKVFYFLIYFKFYSGLKKIFNKIVVKH